MKRYPNSVEEFLAAPYSERQFVSFFNDGSSAGGGGAWSSGPLFFVFPIPLSDLVASLIVGLIQGCRRAYGRGVPVSLLPSRWSTALQLPPLHPRTKVLYAAHPVEPATYIPITDFHRFAFEHKFSELLLILMRLGAKRITAFHVRGRGADLVNELAIAIPGVEIGGGMGGEVSRDAEILFRAELAGGDCLDLPERLAWYRYEPTWQNMVDGRRHGLESFSLTLHYHDDYGINSNLRVYAERAGFEVKGSFEKHKPTTWRIEVGF